MKRSLIASIIASIPVPAGSPVVTLALAATLVAGSAAPAAADGPKSAISIEVPSLSTAGVSVQYERYVLSDTVRRLSVAGSVAARSTAGGDYDSRTLGGAAELRHWITGRSAWSSLEEAMVGLYVGLRLEFGHTATTDRMAEQSIGSTLAMGSSLALGYRFAPWSRVEITPSAGVGGRLEKDLTGRTGVWGRPTLTLGLTVGWLY